MEDTRGVVNVILKGPADKFDHVLALVQDAGIVAKRDEYEPEAISAFLTDGTDDPSNEFVDQCEARVSALVAGTGFSVDRASVWASNAATRQMPYNRHTGEWLEQFVDGEAPLAVREEQLQHLADQKGISVNDIELRDFLQPPTD